MKEPSSDWISSIQQDFEGIIEAFSTTGSRTPTLIPGERRSVAVLFLDLIGFTAMSERMDHETLHAVTSSVMGRLSGLVEFHGGYVDKFEGDRIMALFGADKAHENDCVRAVSCAIRMIDVVQEFSALLSARGFSTGARAGISYGDVTVAPDPSGHLTATGDVVNTASRVEETAETNTVQVTQTVRDTAGEHFKWKDLGPVSIRGKTDRLHTYRPTGPGRTQLERWERARMLSRVPFVGRQDELEELGRTLKCQSDRLTGQNRRGGARHIFVGIMGAAGIGKSRLVHEFSRDPQVRSDDTLVMKAGCASYAQPPLQLILSLVRNWLFPGHSRIPSEEEVRRALKKCLSGILSDRGGIRKETSDTLSLLLSSGEGGLPLSTGLSPEEARLRTLSSVSDLFRTLSDSVERMVVILDDVHWIDSASRECLQFLADSCDTRAPMLFILIYRPEPALGHDLLERLPGDYAAKTEITLKEIDPDSSRKLIRHLLYQKHQSDASDEIVEYILNVSGGNAFFIEELVLGLTEKGLLRQRESGEWTLTADPGSMVIPGSIKGIIRARTDQLPPDPRRVLQVASVLGEEFSSHVLLRVVSDTGVETDTEGSLEELLARGFLNTGRESETLFRFHHVLARDAVYETILKQNRRFLHSICADVLIRLEERDPSLAASITQHLDDAGDIDRAIPWGAKAQLLAIRRYDGDAVIHWAEKLEGWIRDRLNSEDDARMLREVLNRRQIVEGYSLEAEPQKATLEKMRELIEAWDLQDLRAEYLMSVGSRLRRSAQLPGATEKFRDALELFRQARNRSGIARASSALAMCSKNLGLLRESEDEQRFAISIFRELEDTENIARSLFRLASTLLLMGRHEEGLLTLDEAIVPAVDSGARTIEANIYSLRGILYLQTGKYGEALKNHLKAIAIYREVGDKSDELSALNSISNAHYRMSNLDEARSFGLEALQASREFDARHTRANVLCTLGLVELASGQDAEAADYFLKSLQAHRDIGNRFAEAAVQWNLSLASYNLLDFDAGLEHAREAIRLYREVGNRYRAASKLNLHPLVLIEMGRTDEAIACLEEYERDFAGIDDVKVIIQSGYARGCLALSNGDLEQAERCFIKALDTARENDCSESVALSLQNLGLIRLEQGNRKEALEYLRQGFEALDDTVYFRNYVPDAEYFLMTGDTERAVHFAGKALARAQATGNSVNLRRSREILEELGAG